MESTVVPGPSAPLLQTCSVFSCRAAEAVRCSSLAMLRCRQLKELKIIILSSTGSIKMAKISETLRQGATVMRATWAGNRGAVTKGRRGFHEEGKIHSLNFTEYEGLLDDFFPENYSLDYDDLDSFPEPCHRTYCSVFGGSNIPVFLAVASTLGLASNLVFGLALAKWPRLWDQHRPSKAALFLMTAASILFAAILPFFAAEVLQQGWGFGDRFCPVAQALLYGCLFAQGLLLAGSACQLPGHCSGSLLPTVLWASGFILAIPAGKISSTGREEETVCVLSVEPELSLWSLAHALCCLAVFLLLPVGMLLTKMAGRWGRCGCWQLDISMACIFYLFWALYGVAATLSVLLNMELLVPSCKLQETLDYFLGLSKGLGMLHCFVCPLLILGVAIYHQKAGPVSDS